MINEGLFSSSNKEWETPPELFGAYDSLYHFTLDVCASPENAKHPCYYTKDDDGLAQDWRGFRCWMNPPYGREVGKWVGKAATSGALVVALLPARTDTRWWQKHIAHNPSVSVRFLPGRVRFVGATSGAPFPSAIVAFNAHPVEVPA